MEMSYISWYLSICAKKLLDSSSRVCEWGSNTMRPKLHHLSIIFESSMMRAMFVREEMASLGLGNLPSSNLYKAIKSSSYEKSYLSVNKAAIYKASYKFRQQHTISSPNSHRHSPNHLHLAKRWHRSGP
mmetsp:Transcript_8246/g.13923  ORF Transcript_8246/g.13923 Transcript_8246/m.13923 type:complete len:129 (-) Transcript_8246:1323-1709(-)